MKRLFLTTMVVAILGLSGCASWYPETTADKFPGSPSATSLKLQKQEADRRSAEMSAFQTNTPWLVASTVVEYEQYPSLNRKPVEIAQYNRTLPQMVARISEKAGVNIFLASDLYRAPEESQEQDAEALGEDGFGIGFDSSGISASTDDSSVLTLLSSSTPTMGGRLEEPLKQKISVVINGSASQLLDSIASQLGIAWKYNETRNRVTFYRLTRENFQVFFPGLTNTKLSMGGAGEGSSDSVIEQKSEMELEGGDWDELAEGVEALLTPYGKATVIKSTGNIIVVDTPEAMEDITSFIEDLNDVYSRQVHLQIRTASVTVENGNDFNLTWNNILNTVNGGEFGLGLNSASVGTGSTPNVMNVIRSSTGASLALEMLAQQTESTEINEQSVTTLSNQPASLKVLTETGYISAISQQASETSNLDNVISDVEVTTINTGFDATLVPRVISDSVLQLQVALELSNNLVLVNFDSTIVQTPTRDRNAVVQRAWLRNGETWVLAAFNSEKSKKQESGTGSPGFWGFGGGTSKSNEQQVLLIMITPHIQEGMF
jgi:type IVB pilus formation R64 PilN family outer membrane protein